jgi:hypothetical protein
MARRKSIGAAGLVFGAIIALAGQKAMADSGSWSGIIINSGCTPDEAFAEAPKCIADVPGGKLSLYDDTIRQVYALDPQDQAAGHLGDAVTVQGSLQGGAIRVSSIKPLAGIGLAVGHKAPVFSARDQFGHVQTLDTLRGPKGTVLLFFRSADW